MDLLVFLFFVFLFVVAFFYFRKDAMQAFIAVVFVNLYFPTYLSFGPIRYATIFSFISLFFIFRYLTQGRHEPLSNRLLKIEATYILILLLFGVLSDTIFIGRQYSYIRTIIANFSIYSIIFIYIFNRKDNIERFYKFLAAFLFALTLYGVYCYTTGSNIAIAVLNAAYGQSDLILDSFSTELRGGLEGRIQGLSGHPLDYAGHMLVSFFIILHYIYDIKRKFSLPLVILLMLIAVNLFLTGSRAGMVGFVVGLFSWIYLFGNISFKGKFALTLGLVALYIIIARSVMDDYEDYISSFLYFWESSDSVKGSSFEMRLEQLEGAFDIIDNNPYSYLFGIGADWVRQYSMEHQGLHPVLRGFESIVFIGLIEFGVVGLFVVTFGLYYLLYRFSRKCHASKTSALMMLGFLVFQLFTGNYAFPLFVAGLMVMSKDASLRLIDDEY